MNNSKFTLISLATTLAFCSSAFAQNMTKEEYKAGKEKIEAEHKSGKMQCDKSAGNAKDICIAEAKGKESVAKAELEAKYKNTSKAYYELNIAKADANYAVAESRCNDKSGDSKDLCKKEAKAVHSAAKAEAKARLNQ